MPKERLHILLADRSMEAMSSFGLVQPHGQQEKEAYLLGAISPDALFYDIPFLGLTPLGIALHRYDGRSSTAFFLSRLKEEKIFVRPEIRAWMLGVASHFVVDDEWHPRIYTVSSPPFPPCAALRLSTRQCHHWLESELEAHWLSALGPPDGYIPLLRRLAGKKDLLVECSRAFRDLLIDGGFGTVPGPGRIRRCLLWQMLMIRQLFAHARWGRWKPGLLGRRMTRSLAAFIVPRRTTLPEMPATAPRGEETVADLFHPELFNRTLRSLSNHLTELSAR